MSYIKKVTITNEWKSLDELIGEEVVSGAKYKIQNDGSSAIKLQEVVLLPASDDFDGVTLYSTFVISYEKTGSDYLWLRAMGDIPVDVNVYV